MGGWGVTCNRDRQPDKHNVHSINTDSPRGGGMEERGEGGGG